MSNELVIGIDFGSDSVRALVVDPATGRELGQSVHPYSRWNKGLYSNAQENRFRQHPLDYIEGLEASVKGALHNAGNNAGSKIAGISIDTTGSTPCAVDRTGTPLALTDEFKDDPDAMFNLWKDHTAIAESEEINAHARNWGGEDFTRYSGGIYSPEWFWAKVLHTLRINKKIRNAAYSWIEHSDWMPFLLTGGKDLGKVISSRCTAGHKAMWHTAWGGYPSEAFFSSLDPLLSGLRNRLPPRTFTTDTPVGKISSYWADRLGISKDAVVGTGALDAHIGAVGGGIVPGTMVKVMGTSTCDMIIAESSGSIEKIVRGISGQVDGSIIPGYIGYEAGQSAFGDVYAWFNNLISWSHKGAETGSTDSILPALEKEAQNLPLNDSVIALDWFNGRRTPDNNPHAKGAVFGLTLSSSAPEIYRALIEATAFGSKAIMDRFISEGINIDTILAVGGVAKKSPFGMQIMADVLNKPIRVSSSQQTVAIGAAMFASVVCGFHTNIQQAQKVMSPGISDEYHPDPDKAVHYTSIYEKYRKLGNCTTDL